MDTSIGLDTINEWCESAFNLRTQIDSLKDKTDELNYQLTEIQNKVISVLTEQGLDSFKSSCGTVSVANKLSVKTPKLPEDKEAFFNYLKKKGIFESLVSVNSQTLNAFYKAELDAAKASGEPEENFRLPGLNDVKQYQQLMMRKS